MKSGPWERVRLRAEVCTRVQRPLRLRSPLRASKTSNGPLSVEWKPTVKRSKTSGGSRGDARQGDEFSRCRDQRKVTNILNWPPAPPIMALRPQRFRSCDYYIHRRREGR